MKDQRRELTPPRATPGDDAHAIARSALGVVPFAGTGAVELFNRIITPPIERRRDEWRIAVGQALDELLNREQLTVSALIADESFTTVLLQASAIAVRNHEREKLEALRNAVLNSAQPLPIDISKREMFLQLVDQFTVWHLRILQLFAAPKEWLNVHRKRAPEFSLSSSLEAVLLAAYPELKDQRDFYDVIGNELHAKGLFNTNGLHGMMTAQGAYQKRTTALADQFLLFIREPEQKA